MASAATGSLKLTAVIITDDLSVKPVPAAEFVIVNENAVQPATVTTNLQGIATVDLVPGKYILKSARPVVYLGKSLSWAKPFEIKDAVETDLQITSNDAEVAEITSGRQFDDAGKLYSRLKNSVVTIETDSGNGSGFIVSPNLIVTNGHVVEGALTVRVRFSKGQKVKAILLAQDKQRDVAVVAADLSSFPSASVCRLAKPPVGEPLVVEGEKVIAIGSPLNQDKILTTGIVSKVEKGAIISDVNINHGNSGGPLINMAGEVVGITTFGDTPEQGGGPGISGIIPISLASSVLAEAEPRLKTTDLPKPTLLPDVPETPFPVEALHDSAGKDLHPYHINDPDDFETLIFTPPINESLHNAALRSVSKVKRIRDRKRSDRGVQDSMELPQKELWTQYVGENAALVVVIVRPVLKETTGSKWRRAAGAVSGVRLAAKLRYKDDFYCMELWRDNHVVEPVHLYRVKRPVSFSGAAAYAEDIAYAGIYVYDPSAFSAGSKITLKVAMESDPRNFHEYEVPAKIQKQVWEDFAPWVSANNASKSAHDQP